MTPHDSVRVHQPTALEQKGPTSQEAAVKWGDLGKCLEIRSDNPDLPTNTEHLSNTEVHPTAARH